MATFRAARDDEDETLARLLYNAFRLNWGTNWENNMSSPLPEISPSPKHNEKIPGAAASRLALWKSTFPLTRRLGGHIDVAVAPDEDIPAAVACFLPPGVRPGYVSLLLSGWLSAFFQLHPRTAYRFRDGAVLAEKLWPPVLEPLGERYQDGAYVLVLGTDPGHAGHGYAAKLLQWQIERCRSEFPKIPLYLETATDHAQRVYEKLGFEEMTRGQIKLRGVDERGCRLPKDSLEPDESKVPYFALRCMRLAPT